MAHNLLFPRIAAIIKRRAPAGAGVPPVDFSPYLIEEDFEDGTDYDMGATWIETPGTGTIAPNHTPALAGSESLALTGNAQILAEFTGTPGVTACGLIRFPDLPAEYAGFLLIQDAFGNVLAQVVRVGTKFVVASGAGLNASAVDLTTGTDFYLWLEYEAGSGADAVANLYVSENTTKPGSPSASITNSNVTANAGAVVLRSGETSLVADHIRVKAGSPGTLTAWPL